jgi:hypothetical protein
MTGARAVAIVSLLALPACGSALPELPASSAASLNAQAAPLPRVGVQPDDEAPSSPSDQPEPDPHAHHHHAH